jgi:hypothetical protein
VVAKVTDNYLLAGFPEAPVVHTFIQDLQGLVLAKDRAAIASKIRYPLRVNTRSGSFLVESPAQLLASFDRVFPASVLRVLLKCPRSGLYCDKRGVMIGSGEIWLAPKSGEVVAPSNNKDPVQPEIIAVNLP